MKRRNVISFLSGFVACIPFAGLLFNKKKDMRFWIQDAKDKLHYSENPEPFNLASFQKMQDSLMNETRIKSINIGGKSYRAVVMYDEEILKHIKKYKNVGYYEIGKLGIVK